MEGRLWKIRAQSHIHSVVRHFFNIPASLRANKAPSNCLMMLNNWDFTNCYRPATDYIIIIACSKNRVSCMLLWYVHEGFLDDETWIKYAFLYHLFKIKFCRSRQNQTRAWKRIKADIKTKSAQLLYLLVKGSITYFLLTKDGLRTTLDKSFFNV